MRSAFKESDVLNALLLDGRGNPFHVIEGVAEQDDAAVLAVPVDHEICVTTDFVRGTGFTLHQRGWLSMRDLGRYLVAANVSDLAAMGAAPHAFLSVVRYAPERTLDDVRELLGGIDEACAEFRCPLVGGDSGSYHADVLSGTAIGIVPRGRRLSRHTIKSGDVVLVSGCIGGGAAALAAAVSDVAVAPGSLDLAVARWRRPKPRIGLGCALLDVPYRVSCMDVSDGLTASLTQLARISGLGFEINPARLPIDPSATAIARTLSLNELALACGASVDFELLVACPANALDAVTAAAAAAGTPLTMIGRCTTGGRVVLSSGAAAGDPLPGEPWDHQSADMRALFHA